MLIWNYRVFLRFFRGPGVLPLPPFQLDRFRLYLAPELDARLFRAGNKNYPSDGSLGAPVVRLAKFATGKIRVNSFLSGRAPQRVRQVSSARAARDRGAGSFSKEHESRRSRHDIRSDWRVPSHTRFTPRLRDMLLDCGPILDALCPGTATFATLTLPGSTKKALEAASKASGYLVDAVNNYLRKNLQGGCYAYVWEWQTRGALHLHYCLGTLSLEQQATVSYGLRRTWINALERAGDKLGVDMFARRTGGSHKGAKLSYCVDIRALTQGAVGYVSKYTTKACKSGKAPRSFPPGRWGGVSMPLRARIKAERFVWSFNVPSQDSGSRVLATFAELMQSFGDKVRYLPASDKVAAPIVTGVCGKTEKWEFFARAITRLREVVESAWKCAESEVSCYYKMRPGGCYP